MRSAIAIPAGDLSIVVSEDNIATGLISGVEGTDYVRCTTDTALVANTWQFFSIAKSLSNLNATISVGLYADDTIASGAVLYVDDVRPATELTATDSDISSFDSFRQTAENDPWWTFSTGVDGRKQSVGCLTVGALGGFLSNAGPVIELH